jgi:hypothetical protein
MTVLQAGEPPSVKLNRYIERPLLAVRPGNSQFPPLATKIGPQYVGLRTGAPIKPFAADYLTHYAKCKRGDYGEAVLSVKALVKLAAEGRKLAAYLCEVAVAVHTNSAKTTQKLRWRRVLGVILGAW